MDLFEIPDIAGDDAAHSIKLPAPAAWLQLSFAGSASSAPRFGGSGVTSAQGCQIIGTSQYFPFQGGCRFYQSGEINVFIPSGLTLSGAGQKGF